MLITVQSPAMKRKLVTFLALALLAIPAASPYFLPDVPRTNDLPPHLMRVYFWGQAVTYSGLWPRWSAELVYGHGYPVFNFFPSLFHAFTQLFHQLGLPLLTAYRAVVYLHSLLAAIGSYLLGKQIFHSRLAGWGTAVLYVYSPYLLYDAHVRGSGPETQALALLPFLILAIWQASEQLTINRKQRTGNKEQKSLTIYHLPLTINHSKWVVLTAVFFALTFLSHPIIYLLLIPIGVWLLIKAGFARKNGRFWQTLIGPAVGIGLGGLLVAFFWLPAFMEVQFTRADLSISQGYAYQENFLSLLDMLRWPNIPADPALINPPVVRAIPVVGLVWAVVVIGWQWRRTTHLQREIVVSWTAVLLLSIWLITPTSVFVWDNFPLLRLIFYPWRLLSMTSVATAVLVGLSIQILVTQPRWQTSKRAILPAILLTSLILISSIPWLYPPRQTMPEEIDAAKALSSELPPFFIGTTTLGEFLPLQVDKLPPPLLQEAELHAGKNPDRLQVQDGLAWIRLDENPINAQYQIQLNTTQTLTYNQFYFPGWEVLLDGTAIPIMPSQPEGLITFVVPEGEHNLQIRFGSSWARTVGWIISGSAFIALIALSILAIRHPQKETTLLTDAAFVKPSYLLLLGATAVLIWLFFTFVDTPLRRSTLQPDGIVGKPITQQVDFAGEVRLLSYEIPETAVSAAELIPITLYLKAQRNIGVPYTIGIQLHDAQGVNWLENHIRPTDWRFIADEPWPLDAYRMEPYLLDLVDGAPPGTYQLYVGLVRDDTKETVIAHNIATIQIDEPMQGDTALEDGMVGVTDTAVANDIQLLGTRLDRAVMAPGDPIRVTSLWQVKGDNPGNQFTLQLITDDGASLLQETIIIAPEYPVAQWHTGSRLRAETLLRLPASTPDGTHHWQIRWGDQIIDAGTITVDAPERSFEIPEMDTAVNETFGDLVTLLGLNMQQLTENREQGTDNTLSPQSSTLITLVWQAKNETPTSYRVFVHLVAPDGTILTQSDSEPANWSRPTTGWLPGEIVQDTHQLTLPEELPDGAYLRIGLYDPTTGERLSTETAEFITIPIDK